jgi:endoglucanase Acf2
MWAHPLLFRAESGGLRIGYPTEYEVTEARYFAKPVHDLLLGTDSLQASETRVADYGDWTVTAEWPAGATSMRATFGRGLPYVWVEGSGARIDLLGNGDVQNMGESAVIQIGDRAYAAMVPTGSEWRIEDNVLTADVAHFVVALLPDNAASTLDLVRAHAFNIVRDTRVSWHYDPEASTVTTTFSMEIESVDPGAQPALGTLSALYPHQWLNSGAPQTGLGYDSPRGRMRLVSGSEFTTTVTYDGVLPRLPDLCLSGGDDRLRSLLTETFARDDAFSGALSREDTYWSGKAAGRLSELISLAKAVRLNEAAEHWTNQLRDRTESWLSAEDTSRFFFYDENWKTLIGYPTSFGSDSELNDHDFHFGYHIQAAATLSRADSAWGAAWGPMVDMLIRDAANSDRLDSRFPFLRSFDPYAGHSIAGGHTDKVGGYDRESSSESMNFSAALINWGMERGDDTIRDLGIWLYATEAAAIEQYWFDVDDNVFPPGFEHTTSAIVWGRGGAYETWWSPKPAYVHGINYLPLTGASFYLGRHPDYIRRNDAELQEAAAGQPPLWQDLSTMFFALAAPAEAMRRYETFAADYRPEDGESPPHTYHWLAALNQIGTVDTTVTANIPAYRVFHNGKRRAYAAYNPRSIPTRARFSDGAEFRVPHRTQLTVCR